MFKLIFMVVLGLVVMDRSFAVEMDVSSMVQRADEYRLKEAAAKVVSVVQLYHDGQLEKPISMMSMCVKSRIASAVSIGDRSWTKNVDARR